MVSDQDESTCRRTRELVFETSAAMVESFKLGMVPKGVV